MRFVRSLRQRLLFEQAADDKPYLAKFAVRSARGAHFASLLEDNLRPELHHAFDLLEKYSSHTSRLLSDAAALDQRVSVMQRQPRNFTKPDADFLRRLMTDPAITIKPADKNLGMVLVDTVWYNAELARMLADTVTYARFRPPMRGPERRRTRIDFPAYKKELLAELRKLGVTHAKAFEYLDKSGVHCASDMLKCVTQRATDENSTVPTIYLLIKVHKASGLCGRPIVPSTHWLTTGPSIVVDHLLQEILRKANIAHIVKDTKSFVVELENLRLPTGGGVFVTADIASLYTNIDTKMGLALVRRFLTEQDVPPVVASLIMALLTFVMSHSYLQFDGKIFHQIDGTAMGTACAPAYANIVVYMLEKQVIADMARVVHLYRRFLDDVFAYLERSAVAEFIHRMNHLHPKLRFEFVTHDSEAAFLDLRIHKGPRFTESLIFDLSVHQKKMNLYLYIPFHSFHTDAAKRSFIQTELMRYIRNSSDRTEYSDLKRIFYQRLRDRGYPSSFLQPLFSSIFYADRRFFLWPAKTLHLHPDIVTRPPLSACLQRRMQRWTASQSSSATAPAIQSRPVFVIPYSPLSAVLPTRQLLMRAWDLIQDAMPQPIPGPIIAYQSSSSLLKTLVYSRARLMELAARPPPTQPAAAPTQTRLSSFVARDAASSLSGPSPHSQ